MHRAQCWSRSFASALSFLLGVCDLSCGTPGSGGKSPATSILLRDPTTAVSPQAADPAALTRPAAGPQGCLSACSSSPSGVRSSWHRCVRLLLCSLVFAGAFLGLQAPRGLYSFPRLGSALRSSEGHLLLALPLSFPAAFAGSCREAAVPVGSGLSVCAVASSSAHPPNSSAVVTSSCCLTPVGALPSCQRRPCLLQLAQPGAWLVRAVGEGLGVPNPVSLEL